MESHPGRLEMVRQAHHAQQQLYHHQRDGQDREDETSAVARNPSLSFRAVSRAVPRETKRFESAGHDYGGGDQGGETMDHVPAARGVGGPEDVRGGRRVHSQDRGARAESERGAGSGVVEKCPQEHFHEDGGDRQIGPRMHGCGAWIDAFARRDPSGPRAEAHGETEGEEPQSQRQVRHGDHGG